MNLCRLESDCVKRLVLRNVRRYFGDDPERSAAECGPAAFAAFAFASGVPPNSRRSAVLQALKKTSSASAGLQSEGRARLPVSAPEPRDAVLMAVLELLPLATLCRVCARVSKRWRRCVYCIPRWRSLCEGLGVQCARHLPQGVCREAAWREAYVVAAADISSSNEDGRRTSLAILGDQGSGRLTLLCGLSIAATAYQRRYDKLVEHARNVGVPPIFLEHNRHRVQLQRGRRELHMPLDCVTSDCMLYSLGIRPTLKEAGALLSQVDVALLVLSADTFRRSPQSTANSLGWQQQALLAFSLGVRRLIVVVTKMGLVRYSKEAFISICADAKKSLLQLGWRPEKLWFVPVDTLDEDNVAFASNSMPWLDGSPCLYHHLIALLPRTPIHEASSSPFRMAIRAVYSIFRNTAVAGRVLSGRVCKGDRLKAAGASRACTVNSIEFCWNEIASGSSGDCIALSFARGLGLCAGMVLGSSDNPPRAATSFTATIAVLASNLSIRAGFTPLLLLHTDHVPCRLVEIVSGATSSGVALPPPAPASLSRGQFAIVRFVPLRPVCTEPFPSRLGRFAAIDHGTVCIAGVVLRVVS